MGKQLIISIGREFGSGGHEIAMIIAKHYGLTLLDHNILDEIAAEKGINVSRLRELDEKNKNVLTSRRVKGMSSSPEENVYLMQFDYMHKLASGGESFVVVGRCSESVLKEYDCMISVFILGDKDKKVKRVMEKFNLSETVAEKMAYEKDMKRKKYHNTYCEGKWGDSRNYDISVNSSILGIEGTAGMLIDFIDRVKQKDNS